MLASVSKAPFKLMQHAPEQTAEQRAAQRAKTNEATAQWRIYTDVGRDLVAQASNLTSGSPGFWHTAECTFAAVV